MAGKILEVSYDLDGQAVRLTVSRATVVIGMRRAIMALEGAEVMKDEKDNALLALRGITYPALISGTISAEGIPWPLSFEDFCDLPDDLIVQWEQAVYELNPHWNPAGVMDEELEKKALKSTSE